MCAQSVLRGLKLFENIFRSADELEYICEQIKDGSTCQLSQWEIFLKDLNQDLQTYKAAHQKLEKLLKQKDSQHQSYVRRTQK